LTFRLPGVTTEDNGTTNKRPVTMEELLVSSLAQTDALAKLENLLRAKLRDSDARRIECKAKRELNFQPRPLEWIVDTAVAHAS
jgi:hypothetical protein